MANLLLINILILEIVLDIFEKLILDSESFCGFLTLNATHIKLISLILCLIKGKNTNMSSTPQPERKIQYCI